MSCDPAEHSEPPPRRSRCFYSVLFAVVLPFWGAIPLSWAFVIYSFWTGRIWLYRTLGLISFAIALCEVLFSLYHWYLALHVASITPCAPPPSHEMQAAITRLLKAGLAALPEDGGDHESLHVERPGSPEEAITELSYDDPRAVDFRNSLRTWFRKVPWSSVQLNDLRKWIYWSLFNAKMPDYDQLDLNQRVQLEQALDLLQKRLGCKVPDGHSTDVQPMCLTVDPVQIMNRPFLFYAAIKSINLTLQKYYHTKWNARHGSHDGLEYILRIPPAWDCHTSPRPLIFIHGLGMGLLQYHLLISHLLETMLDRPVLILLQPHISQDIFHPHFLNPPSRHTMSKQLAALLHALGWANAEYVDEDYRDELEEQAVTAPVDKKRGVTLLSHSNGSYTHAWMLKEHPLLVTRSCFVDPVTFCSWEGDVCYNFLYRPPATGMELLMKYFVGTELGVANLLQRHFDWVSNSLWYEEIPNACDHTKTLFLLGGADNIVSSERVRRYLRSHGVRNNLFFDPHARHGESLITGSLGHTEILRWLQEHE